NPEQFKSFVNTVFGQPWDDPTFDKLDWETLLAKAEPYKPLTCPAGVQVLTAGVDVQADRLAVAVYGWGPGEESWLIYWIELYGSVVTDEPWDQLKEFLSAEFESANGTPLKILRTLIDSSAYTQDVYQRVRSLGLPIIPGKGLSTAAKPIINRPTDQDVTWQGRTIKNGIKIWPLGVDTAKDQIHARLSLKSGPGAIHTPIGTPEDFYKQLCGERRETKYIKGFPVRVWTKVAGVRNEALDCTVYAVAAALSLGIHLHSWNWATPDKVEPEKPKPPEQGWVSQRRNTKGWMKKR
ncbi:MAG: terminase gpA endonuclease subunit, partial [Microcoleus sp.]